MCTDYRYGKYPKSQCRTKWPSIVIICHFCINGRYVGGREYYYNVNISSLLFPITVSYFLFVSMMDRTPPYELTITPSIFWSTLKEI